MENLFYTIISVCALAGFILAYNIHKKKRSKKPLVCPLKFHCDTVVHSEYSKLFGIHLEYLGMLYYAIIFLSYTFFIFFPQARIHNIFVLGVTAATGVAFFFSIYLTGIQAFVLKQWCTWCLISAGLCTIIFFFVIQASLFDMIPYLSEYRLIILAIHLVGLTLGFGGALIADIFFFRSSVDEKISNDEVETLKTLSQIIWIGLGILVISGCLMFLSDIERYIMSAKFLAKTFIVGVIVINGFLLNTIITPVLTKIPFGKILSSHDKEMRDFRRLTFALGAISTASWWSAFILGIMRGSPAPYPIILAAYFTVLSVALIGSQIVEEILYKIKTKGSDMGLTNKKCKPCESGTKPFDSNETKTYMSYLKTSWELSEDNKKIERKFKFEDFVEAMKFVNQVADIAEQEGHHPDIKISYNRVRITLWTYAISGLSINDFILASKIETL